MTSQGRPGLQGGLDASVPHHHTAFKIIGVAMEVHNKLGPGHREEVYQRAMLKKLPEAGLETQEQVPVEVRLDGESLLTYYLDLLVEQAVIVELKAHFHPLTNDDLAQVIDYLAATGLSVALLFNFGRSRLEYRRILPPRKITVKRRREWTKPRSPHSPLDGLLTGGRRMKLSPLVRISLGQDHGLAPAYSLIRCLFVVATLLSAES